MEVGNGPEGLSGHEKKRRREGQPADSAESAPKPWLGWDPSKLANVRARLKKLFSEKSKKKLRQGGNQTNHPKKRGIRVRKNGPPLEIQNTRKT
jgi:hypothetical protein